MKVTRNQVIMEALNQFGREDYDRVSLQSIGSALDITKGGVYHYFSSKDELFKETVIYVMDSIEEFTIAQFDPTVSISEQLKPFFNLHQISEMYAEIIGFDVFRDYSVLVSLMFSAIKKFDEVRERISQLYTSMLGSFTDLFREAQQRGEIREDRDPEALAFELSSLIEGGLLITAISKVDDQIFMKTYKDYLKHILSEEGS